MASRDFTAPEYPQCKATQREKPNFPITEELLQTITDDTYMIPLFEQKVFEYKYMKHNSLKTNELLKCRLRGYIKDLEGKTCTPFQFPKAIHNHYRNYLVRYLPKETINERVSHRLIMTAGPGVDEYGQIPIPNDMHLRKPTHGASSNIKKAKHDKS